ncbi:MAG: cupin domain-containing protein [Longimicrobiales bacterium]
MTTPPATLRLENRHTGEVLELSRFWENGVECLRLVGSLPPGGEGPPLHIHYIEDEEGVVRSGLLSAVVDGVRIDARAGERVTLPRGLPHRWWNGGSELLVFDGSAKPLGDIDRYLQAAFEIANASPSNRPSLFYIAHLALRHRHNQTVLVMPGPVQAVLFRAAVAIGTLLGKYRGTDWPGCPARCAGTAPLSAGR